jgi:hypothetical protein
MQENAEIYSVGQKHHKNGAPEWKERIVLLNCAPGILLVDHRYGVSTFNVI